MIISCYVMHSSPKFYSALSYYIFYYRVYLISALIIFSCTSSVAGIIGSAHDFSDQFTINGEICIVCHTPHDSDTTAMLPLWNHEISTAVYIIYNSSTMDVEAEQPGPGSYSRLCLSCHDGAVAIDSYRGSTSSTSTFAPESVIIGTDLSDDHPVGVSWEHQTVEDFAICFNCHDLRNEPPEPVGRELKFFNGKVECPSCHDVHNNAVMDVKLLLTTTH